jgi:hypothetical protein
LGGSIKLLQDAFSEASEMDENENYRKDYASVINETKVFLAECKAQE